MMFIGFGAPTRFNISRGPINVVQGQFIVPTFCNDPTQAANSECAGLVDCSNSLYAANPICVVKLGIDCSQPANATNPACQYVDCTNANNYESPACVGQINCSDPYFAGYPSCISTTTGGTTTTVDCTQAANATNPACVEICGIDPAACAETGIVANDCTNPANATNPMCMPATATGVPSWLWLVGLGIVGLLVYKHVKAKSATSSPT